MQMELLHRKMQHFIRQVDRILADMEGAIPSSQTRDNVYQKDGGKTWTDGFWCGMLNLAYEYTKDEKYKEAALKLVDVFYDRILHKIAVDHHDMGFLYSPSCLAAYQLYGSDKGLQAAILSADQLIGRFREKGEFLQAWGSMDGRPENNRLIIDCLLNLPLLYRVSQITGKTIYGSIAEKHFHTAVGVVIREDYSTHHTYFFDVHTGEPLRGETYQGYSNDSIWARGQAWAVYGLPLNYRYLKEEAILEKYNGVTEKFFDSLPKDRVPYWDMLFTSGEEPRDTSAAMIAVCGVLEMNKYFPNPEFVKKAEAVLEAVLEKHTTEGHSNANGLITDSMYNRKAGHQPECSIWGDYYAMEAVYRLLCPDWKPYW